MDKQIGVWVDHRKAVIVTLWEEKKRAGRSLEIETTGRPSRRDPIRLDMFSDDSLQRHSSVHLKKYYNDIAAYENADSIMLMGPARPKSSFTRASSGT